MSYPTFEHVNLDAVEASLVELILNTDMEIDGVKRMWFSQWEDQVNINQLYDIWHDVLDNMPELN